MTNTLDILLLSCYHYFIVGNSDIIINDIE